MATPASPVDRTVLLRHRVPIVTLLCWEIQTGPSPPDAPRGQTSPSRTPRVAGKQTARPIRLGAGGQQGLLLAGELVEGIGQLRHYPPGQADAWAKAYGDSQRNGRSGAGRSRRARLKVRPHWNQDRNSSSTRLPGYPGGIRVGPAPGFITRKKD